MDTTHGLDLKPLAAVRRASGAPGTAEAARLLAASGVPVFRCVQGSTRPLMVGGPRVASSNLDRVAWWWSRHPTTNLAVPTGAASGLDVLELRLTPGTRAGLDQVRQAVRSGLVPRPGLVMTTPSGGLQLFFPRVPQTSQPSWSAPETGLAFHGDRGYVVVPPSLVQLPDGAVARYQLIGSPNTSAVPVDALALRRHASLRPALLGAPVLERARAARAAAPALAARSATPGVPAVSRPDPTTVPGRRPPEVVSL